MRYSRGSHKPKGRVRDKSPAFGNRGRGRKLTAETDQQRAVRKIFKGIAGGKTR